MIRRTFMRWVSAASIAASTALFQFGLQAQALSQEPIQPNERQQKVLLSPVLEALEDWNLARCERGGVIHDLYASCGIPVYSETTGRLLGYAPTKKMAGSAYRLKSRREMMFAWGGLERGEDS